MLIGRISVKTVCSDSLKMLVLLGVTSNIFWLSYIFKANHILNKFEYCWLILMLHIFSWYMTSYFFLLRRIKLKANLTECINNKNKLKTRSRKLSKAYFREKKCSSEGIFWYIGLEFSLKWIFLDCQGLFEALLALAIFRLSRIIPVLWPFL